MDTVRKIIILVSWAAFIVFGTLLVIHFVNKAEDQKLNDDISNIYSQGVDNESQGAPQNSYIQSGIDIESGSKEPPKVLERFRSLLEINKDIVGWLSVGDDKFIDYPVLQADDNDYYLAHNYKGEKSTSGSLCVDYRIDLSDGKKPGNIVIYGHRMASGEYFGKLTNYFNYSASSDKNNIYFYKTHPTLEFTTLYEEKKYKIFAGMLVKVNSGDDDFAYHRKHNFANAADFNNFCAEILDRSTFISPDVDLKYGDKLITLSTCVLSDYYGDVEKRWVLFAREVREGEDSAVDVSKAYANKSPLFYDEYYAARGGKWEGRGWKENIIEGYSG